MPCIRRRRRRISRNQPSQRHADHIDFAGPNRVVAWARRIDRREHLFPALRKAVAKPNRNRNQRRMFRNAAKKPLLISRRDRRVGKSSDQNQRPLQLPPVGAHHGDSRLRLPFGNVKRRIHRPRRAPPRRNQNQHPRPTASHSRNIAHANMTFNRQSVSTDPFRK